MRVRFGMAVNLLARVVGLLFILAVPCFSQEKGNAVEEKPALQGDVAVTGKVASKPGVKPIATPKKAAQSLPKTAGKEAPKASTSVPGEIEFGFGDGGEGRNASDTAKFEELKFEKSFVIEAKVERPQVQFPLLKEAPPEKPISFEASFRAQILDSPRENTFRLK